MARPGSKSPRPGSEKSPRTPKERRKSEVNEERKTKAKEMVAETGLPLTADDDFVVSKVSKSPRSSSKKSPRTPRTPKSRRKSGVNEERKAKAEEMPNELPLTNDDDVAAKKGSKSPRSGRSGSKSPRRSPRLPARKTEEDDERKAKGKEIAAEKGLLWTKEVPKTGKIYAPVLRDDSHLAHKEIGFLDIGHAEPTHAYDVGGDWKLLYKKPGAPIGPGMTPRASPAASPKPKKERLPPPMKIYVRKWDGRRLCLENVKPDDTIYEIQNRIEDEHNIPRRQQRLRFGSRPLDNSKETLKECGIKNCSTLDLDPFNVHVRAPDGRSCTLPVEPDYTIPEIKDLVEKELGIAPEHQRPIFGGKPLPDNSTLEDNNVGHGDIIDLTPMNIKVVAPDGRSADLLVTPDSTIDDVKKLTEGKLAIAPEDQRPEFKGTPLEDDAATLEDNNIKHGDTIHLQPMEIQVRAPDGRVANLEVSPDDSIGEVKKKVKKQLGIPTKEQRPTFNDQPLPKNSTLKDNGIRHGDLIDLSPMEIYVVDLNGNKGTYVVDPSDSIGSLKSRVEGKTGIAPKDQRLVFEENLLTDDNKTLRDVNIEHQDTLTLEPWRVHVRMPGGKKLTLDINPRIGTPMEVKNMVNKLEGIVPKRQILKFKGDELDSPRPLADFGVQHDDIIDLRLTPAMPKLQSPVIKKDYLKTLDPDRYGKVTVTTYKTRYDGEPGESFIDGPGKKDVTDFKFEKPALKSQKV